MTRFLILFFLISCNAVFAQNITGILVNAESKKPIEFANVGICGKNIGTVTDLKGRFTLSVDPAYDNDSIRFSIVGYEPYSVKVSDFRRKQNKEVSLKVKAYDISEVVVKPKKYVQKILGVKAKSRSVIAGYSDIKLGYECGILMKVKKTAILKKVNINIAGCSFDTLFCRINVYKANGELNFENILTENIYVKIPKEAVKDVVQVDLQSKNIVVDGDFLVSLEFVKDLGPGRLDISSVLFHKTYYRKISQANWTETGPLGVGINVVADVEK